MTEQAKASARKSLGEYKPLIVWPGGRTEICEKSPERQDRLIPGKGVVRGNRLARGTTYATKEEAVAVAQRWIDIRRADAEDRLARYSKQAHFTERMRAHIEGEIRCWGGQA